MDIQEAQKDVTSEDTDKFEEEPEIIHDNTEISLRPVSVVAKMEDNKRKSIFNESQSKADVQENKDKKVEAKSYVQENDIPRKKTEKKVQINEEQAVATLSEAARESELSKNGEAHELKRCSQEEDDDITACESDAEDSDKDCMLDLTNMDHVREYEERTRKPPPFGFSLSKNLRRRYIVALGVLLGALMLGIILFGIIRAATVEEEGTSEFAAAATTEEQVDTTSADPVHGDDYAGYSTDSVSSSTIDQGVETLAPLDSTQDHDNVIQSNPIQTSESPDIISSSSEGPPV